MEHSRGQWFAKNYRSLEEGEVSSCLGSLLAKGEI